MKERLNILGLMSGSSCDGVDAALCSFVMDQSILSYELIAKASFNFPPDLRDNLKTAANKSNKELNNLNTQFSNFLVDLLSKFMAGPDKVDYIASHGHTVLHAPAEGYTLQIGSGAIMSAGTGVPTIVDFRSQDIASGGQGAPLAPLADRYLFDGHNFYLNLGGIVNISHVSDQRITGFDIAPCNQMLNALSNLKGLDYDNGGKLAATGKVNDKLLNKLLDNEYLGKSYPKSLDNSWVKENYTAPLLAYEDTIINKLCSAVEFIAIAIKNDIQQISNFEKTKLDGSTIFCTGGGVFNDYLMDRIKFYVRQLGVEVVIPKPEIVEYKEAMLMALMGYFRVKGKPNCIASVTGANKDVTAGVIYYP